HYIGDSLFFPAIQAYLDSFAFSYASSHDLRDVLSYHTGIDLNGFFNSWVFQPGFPNYSIDSVVLMSGNDVAVYVRQRSKGRDFTGNANIVEITFMDASHNVFSDTLFFDGALGSKVFQPPFEPSLAMLDYNEKMCDATTDRAVFVHQPETIDMTHTFTRVEVKSISDTAFIRINHHWVAPDSLKTPQAGLRLSPYRYWQVEGILPEGFHARGHFQYSRAAFLDNTLLLNQQNDSIVILYRPSPAYDWRPADFTRIGPWSIGWIITDTLKTGEYTFAVWDTSITGNHEPLAPGSNLRLFPNPTSGAVRIEWEAENVTEILISAINGRLVEKISLSKQQRFLEWNNSSLKPGTYIIKLMNQSTPIGSSRFVRIAQ
ncbi:MAG TPA: T9SS type A sorting domain-containing protein, partial [Bacteroidales bacterium]|nr:T9SS type A sorting domain-containing protein [Bacteroidales bacterium]